MEQYRLVFAASALSLHTQPSLSYKDLSIVVQMQQSSGPTRD